MPSPLTAALVDLDGTLVDTLDDFTAALNLMLAEMALPRLAASDVVRMVGKGSEHLVHAALVHVQPAQAPSGVQVQLPRALQLYQRHYATVNGVHSRVYDGALDGLAALQRRGLRLACVTNKPTAFARVLLERKGLAGFFAEVAGGDAFERRKPDPLPLWRTCQALGVPPRQALMVGDSSNDAQAARAAGCPVVLVGGGYNHGRPISEVDADGWLASVAEVPAWLDVWACVQPALPSRASLSR
jgi:phosphoglycolate phosphatase